MLDFVSIVKRSFSCSQIGASGREVAVIYGSLPPATKLAMAARFNDPDDSCKILVATDAIGMGACELVVCML